MKLLVKFNLAFLAIFALVIAATGSIAWTLLQRNAKQEVYDSAKLVIDNALAVRPYTNERIAPLLDTQLRYSFVPEVVSAFSALTVLDKLKKQNPEYRGYQYREPTLNPTNRRNRPADRERDIIASFRTGTATPPVHGECDTPYGRVLYLSKPLKAGASGLRCHSMPAAAPPTMLAAYGPANGFGWTLDEIIGAQVVEVPVAVPLARAREAFVAFMTAPTTTLAAAGGLLNLLIWRIAVRPVMRLSRVADRVSLGDLDTVDFGVRGHDEIRTLADSLARMRKSVVEAMKMLQ